MKDANGRCYETYENLIKREWVGLTNEEIMEQIILSGFNPEWKIEIGMAFSVARNLENKLKEKNK